MNKLDWFSEWDQQKNQIS